MVRGLQVLHLEVSDKDKTYTLLLGWSAENARAAENVDKGEGDKGGGSKKQGNSKKAKDKNIDDKKATSDDARRFLP
jgi:hypothetical protein